MATTSELTDTSLNIAGTTTINGIESTLSNNSSKVATSSAILTAINNSASNVSSYVDSQISNIKYGQFVDLNSGTDLNDLTDPTKIYRSATTSTIATFSNMPETNCNAECMIFYLPFHTNYGKQVYYGKRNNDWFSYERVWDFNHWSSWDGIGKGEIRFKGPYSFRDYEFKSPPSNLCAFFEANLSYFSDALCVIAVVIGKGGNPLLVFSVKALDYGAERMFFCIHYGGALSIFDTNTDGTVTFVTGWNFGN